MPSLNLTKVTPNLYVERTQVAAVTFTRNPGPRINVQLVSGQWVSDDCTALEFMALVGAMPPPESAPPAAAKKQAPRNPRRK